MASTAPAKSQPLHNFALPRLKWNKDAQQGGGHHHQRRRSIKSSSSSSSSPVRHSPLRESGSAATPPRHHSPLPSAPPSLREFPVHSDSLWRQPARRSPIAPDRTLHLQRHDPAPESRSSGKGRADSSEHQSSTDEETKIWNLRPRKPIRASPSENWAMARNIGPAMAEKSKGQSPSNADNGQKKAGGEKKVKRKLNVFISLTKEEIEEDIFSLTGSKPARRPKKRAKNVQRQVDTLFPGAWLMSITADSYKVSENSLKG
ncbi:Protein of unknown function (DUF1639 [Striga hermonthica]|uniref:DUF1639 family protein n=1 Tax=Striga hermonthica TaxID=68872 RepID=A0A9N7MRU6_STRHE|nr:Protein of unknown function (DUF1639 [Striga hermonthica]